MVNHLIPINFITPLFNNMMLVVTLIIFFELQQRGRLKLSILGFFLFSFIVLLMGTRPVDGYYFGDTSTYAAIFRSYQVFGSSTVVDDFFFYGLMRLCARFMDVYAFFLLCAILYVTPIYLISKKWFKKYWFYAFLILVGSFSFWSYGINGVRNGIASSFFLLAISRRRKVFQILWIVLAVGFHKGLALPALGFVITWFYNKPKTFLYFWVATIPLSLLLPNFWGSFFSGFISDNRVSYLTEGNVNNDTFSYVGFRWDFLLYSAAGVFAGWYYIFKKKIKDQKYLQLFNIYLFANAFWVLNIRANFSNRFAYLSWFMLGLVIAYPWLKYQFESQQVRKFSWILLANFAFTYFMNVIVYG